MKHGMHLYLSLSTHVIRCIYLQPLTNLRKEKLKCQFWVNHGVILGHVLSRNGISTDFNKIKLILELPLPTNFKGVQ